MKTQFDIKLTKTEYMRHVAEDEDEPAMLKEEGPRVQAPTGCEWADANADLPSFGQFRRIPRTGEYPIITPDGQWLMINVKLLSFGWRSLAKGEVAEVSTAQKIAIEQAREKRALKNVGASSGENTWE